MLRQALHFQTSRQSETTFALRTQCGFPPVMSLALVLYDHALTLADEITFIWSGRFIWTRILFVISRYWTLLNFIIEHIILSISRPSDKLCLFFSNWFIYTGIFNVVSTGIIMILRVYAMYGCNRRLLIALSVLASASMVTEFIFLGFVIGRAQLAHLPLPGCFLVNTESFAYAYWFPMITFEMTLFVLAIIRSIQFALDDTTTPHLMFVLLRDSIMYFGGMVAVVLANCVIWAVGRESLFTSFTSTYIAIQSILSCRMLLNVHSAANPWHRHNTTIFGLSGRFSSVRFVDRETEDIGLDSLGERHTVQ